MNVQKRELLKRQLERQATLFIMEDDAEETVVSILQLVPHYYGKRKMLWQMR